ncbi:MAG: glycosyltransferase family 4 protein [Dehalococcoidales bacterium]|nr:glycosyltransferase family 4 protein [Dehalococcoidales bacterium]
MSEKKKKVLIVTYHFPPYSTMGGRRVSKLAKYLGEYGWEPVVLTAQRNSNQPQVSPVETSEERIIRTPYFDAYDFVRKFIRVLYAVGTGNDEEFQKNGTWKTLVFGFSQILKIIGTLPVVEIFFYQPFGWYRKAVKKGIELAESEDISLIFSSYGPSTSHLVASTIQKKTNLPWIADFRDLWSENYNNNKVEPFHFIEKRLEKRVLRKAKLLMTVSEPLAEQLKKLHQRRIEILPNGFDEQDYHEDIPLTGKFTITYTGSIYPDKQDISPLFRAVAELRDEKTISREKIEFRFFGTNTLQTIGNLIEKYNISEFVSIHDFIPFTDIVARQKESTVLLVCSWNDPVSKGVYTGKVFEYIGALRPILSIGRQGTVLDELLQETGCGVSVNEPEKIKDILLKWLNEFSTNGDISTGYTPVKEVLERYTRRNQACRLAELFNTICQD